MGGVGPYRVGLFAPAPPNSELNNFLRRCMERTRQPKLSIVIPTLNEERDLPSLLMALDAQDFRDFEVIVADANSPDRTREIAHRHECRIVDGGLPGAGRNAGAEAAHGEVLLFLDADVVPEPEFITGMLKEFDERGLDIATCPAEPIGGHVGDALMLATYNAYVLLTQNIWPHAPGFCILVRRDLHVAMGGFDETVHVAEDADYAKRAAKRGHFGIVITTHIPVSTRRFETDGRFLTSLKYITWDLHRALIGEITEEKRDLFTYKFGHYNNTAERSRIMDILQQSPSDLAKRYLETIRSQMSLFE